MNTTKKNGFLKAAGLMLVVMMLATCVLSGTMAKYTSTANMTATATVANWKIMVDSIEIKDLSTSALDFTIYDTNPSGGKVGDEEVETDMIAPGTWGYAKVNIENQSNVDANIIPLSFLAGRSCMTA